MSRASSTRQAQTGHDRRLLHDQLVPVIRAARVVQVKHKRQIVLGVILRTEVLAFRTDYRDAFALRGFRIQRTR